MDVEHGGDAGANESEAIYHDGGQADYGTAAEPLLWNQFRGGWQGIKARMQPVAPTEEQLRDMSKASGAALEKIAEIFKGKYDDVHIESRGGLRKVYMQGEEMHALWQRLKKMKHDSPEMGLEEALRRLDDRDNSDALVRAVFCEDEVDYILKYKNKEEKHEDLRMEWEYEVLKKGIVLVHECSLEPHQTFIKVYVPFRLLCEEAERLELNVNLLVDASSVEHIAPSFWESLMSKLKIGLFDIDTVEAIPTAAFRADKITKYVGGTSEIECKGSADVAKLKTEFWSNSRRILLTYSVLANTLLGSDKVKELGDSSISSKWNVGVLDLADKGVYTKFFPLHDGGSNFVDGKYNTRAELTQKWTKSFRSLRVPLDTIRDYFGEKVAFYYAFLSLYTWWLVAPSVVGSIVFIFGLVAASKHGIDWDTFDGLELVFDNSLTLPFAVFMSFWATFFLEFWKRKTAYLAWWWDVRDFEQEEKSRPQWYATTVRVSPITGQKEQYYPEYFRLMKMTGSFVCIGVSVFIVLLSVMASIIYKVWAVDTIGECYIPSDALSLCPNSTSLFAEDPIGGHDDQCDDPCWYFLNQGDCEALMLPPENTTAACYWDTDGDGRCVPGCQLYTRRLTCQATNPFGGLNEDRNVCEWTDKYFFADITGAMVSLLCIMVLNMFFMSIARMLNDWENHRTETQYEDALIVKLFFFQFLNNYSTLFYIAYFKGSIATDMFGHPDLTDFCSYGSCLTELMIQLAIIFLGKQTLNQFEEVGIPKIKAYARRKILLREKELVIQRYRGLLEYEGYTGEELDTKSNNMPQWFKDELLEKWDTVVFDDINEMAVQFGFITLFVVAFPLAPLCAFINNFVEIRSDGYKILTGFQRPPPLRAQDLGTWLDVLVVLGIFSVITNSFLIGFSSNWMNDALLGWIGENPTHLEQLAGRLTVVLVFEHVVFGCVFLIRMIVPDVPGPVQTAIDREKYLAGKALVDELIGNARRLHSGSSAGTLGNAGSPDRRQLHDHHDDHHDQEQQYQQSGNSHGIPLPSL